MEIYADALVIVLSGMQPDLFAMTPTRFVGPVELLVVTALNVKTVKWIATSGTNRQRTKWCAHHLRIR